MVRQPIVANEGILQLIETIFTTPRPSQTQSALRICNRENA
jgi:hypothetical protein